MYLAIQKEKKERKLRRRERKKEKGRTERGKTKGIIFILRGLTCVHF